MQTAQSSFDTFLNPYLLALIVSLLVIFNFITAAITAATYDSLAGRPLRYIEYYLRAFGAIIPILVLGALLIVVLFLGIAIIMLFLAAFTAVFGSLGFLLGMVAVVVYFLYVLASFYVLIPVLVIERAGLAGFTRALQVTKGYRWPIVGLLVVTGIFTQVLGWLLGLISNPIISALELNLWSISILNGAIYALSYAAAAILAALVYARLQEIKQGMNVNDLADVFR